MNTQMKIGIGAIAGGVVAVIAGIVLVYKGYIDAVYAEAGWHPQIGLLTLPTIGLLLIVAGAVAMLLSRRRNA
ncbi:hypothetical protein [Microbacterium karelineae]|uniref:hypothetical protein n=1 Tax=Microbacterium karelineae TaxID=2654283 RepID=UPI0012EA7EFF|nr:hypothetical protein [Microbacterium karelineae]